MNHFYSSTKKYLTSVFYLSLLLNAKILNAQTTSFTKCGGNTITATTVLTANGNNGVSAGTYTTALGENPVTWSATGLNIGSGSNKNIVCRAFVNLTVTGGTLKGATGNTSDPFVGIIRSTTPTGSETNAISEITLKNSDNSAFKFESIYLVSQVVNTAGITQASGAYSLTLVGYYQGSQVTNATMTKSYTSNRVWQKFDVSAITAFNNIDEIHVTTSGGANLFNTNVNFDEITISPAVTNSAPTFTNATTTLSVCQNAAATSINSLLQVTDADASQTETFTITSNPTHGTIATGTTVGSGTNVTPTGWSYTPTTGYSGTDAFTVKVKDGTDSASRTITITVKAATSSTTNETACGSYTWGGQTYTASGIYSKTGLTNAAGCDSSATLNLTINTATASTTNTSICDGELPYSWNGLTFTAAGTQSATLTNAANCDSIATLILAVKQSTSSSATIQVCAEDFPYNYFGNNIPFAGSFTFFYTNAVGCDSTLNVTANTKATYSIAASVGSNGSISPNGTTTLCEGQNQNYTITADAGYSVGDVLVDGSSIGAVSSYTFSNVTTNHSIIATFTTNCVATGSNTSHTACSSYVWNGTTYTTSGDKVVHFTNSCGLDSTATLHLIINQPTTSTTSASVCSNQLPYSWNGLTFTAAGIQTAHLTNAKGCDSAATLTLSVATASAPTVSVAASSNNICSGILVTFTATATNEGTSPIYQWKKNGATVGGNINTYSSASLNNNDSVWCVLTSNSACATSTTATSSKVKMIVKTSPLVSPVKNNVSVNITSLTMCTIGGQSTLYNSYLGGTWSSSNPSVATAVNGIAATGASSSGLLTATGNGVTTVTYTIAGGNGCSASASATIFIDAVPTLNAITGSSSVCIAGSTVLSNSSTIPTGGSGVWTSIAGRATVNAGGVVTGVNAGTASIKYTITNASGCSNSTTSSVVVNSFPSIPYVGYAAGSINPQKGASGGFCANKNFTLAGTPSGGLYSSTGAVIVNATTGAASTSSTLGAASVTYTITTNGCSSSQTIAGIVVACASRGVNGATNAKQETRNEFTIYPNPAKTFIRLNVETLIGAGTIVFTDLYGKQVKVQTLSIGSNTVDIASLTKGIYFVSMITSEGKTTKKLVVE